MTLALLLAASPAAAPAASGPFAVVQQYMDAFNRVDMNGAAALCTSSSIVIDDFAPHVWQGGNACAAWGNDFLTWAARNGATHNVVTLGKPTHADVTGDRAYVVVPATYTYLDHGKPAKMTGCTFTVALRKGPAGWRITGWAWADG